MSFYKIENPPRLYHISYVERGQRWPSQRIADDDPTNHHTDLSVHGTVHELGPIDASRAPRVIWPGTRVPGRLLLTGEFADSKPGQCCGDGGAELPAGVQPGLAGFTGDLHRLGHRLPAHCLRDRLHGPDGA